ncbi:MAG: twin-arginine translocase TatA/TatE family subunit [Bacteroidales bacterium]|nr:twin-arginine translocase TatA/TatE family subunit [Bacteroidales bacterium]MBN2761455.1 twin-arginine translocase TatA/TatE family subunit [Bacteroidales bacterium]
MSINSLLFSLGPAEILLIVAIVLLLFGGRKIPELMRGLGQGMREFKKASKEDEAANSSKSSLDNNNSK